MTIHLYVILFAALGFTCCITLNFSVVLVYVRDWWNSRRLLPFDQIMSSTAVTNLLLQFSILYDVILYYSRPYIAFFDVAHLFDIAVFYFLLELHFWQTALLSIYYSAKLVNISQHYLVWLKTKVLSCPSHLLLASVVILLILALPLFWTIQISNVENQTQEVVSMAHPYNLFSMAFGCFLPFTVTLTCIGLNVRLLVSHVWRIKQNISGFSSCPQIQAHVRASRTMILCAAVNLSLIFNSINLFQTKIYMGTTLHFIFWFIFMAHPTIQNIVLIGGNSKLKNRLQIKC
ncbi:taste receptor type 2 member 9-like [Dendropsophus ebraccatus]|uniref:taste receptor type 2 member 9-like n=1 Tax=Dendropsophus ebraccatus TaxID=150705 RepID=UPI0038314016